MAQKKKGKKAASSISSVLGILVVLVYYFLGGGYDTTETVQNEYNHKTEVEVSDTTNVSSELEIYFFDVGQADAILVSNNGEYMLIDAGNNKDGKLLVEELKSLGVTTIDYLVGTHPHEDHIGGFDDVILAFDIENIYMPKRQATSKTFEDVLDAISTKKLKVTTPKVASVFYVGEAACEILSVESDAEDTNDSSIVIEMTFGTNKYLFTGDITETIESGVEWEDIDVLKVAHHGSRYSSSKEFLEETAPEFIVISCGKGNDYGHPHNEALNRLQNTGAEIYRTDKNGTIYLQSDGIDIEIEALDICVDGN